jgi:hypothetical protein
MEFISTPIMNKPNYLIKIFFGALLVVVTIVLIIQVSTSSPLNHLRPSLEPTKTVIPTTSLTGRIVLNLRANSTQLQEGEIITIDLILNQVAKSVVASDVLLKFDPQYLEFNNLTDVDLNYLNPRKFIKKNQLFLSFVLKNDSANGSEQVILARVSFKAIKKGTTSLIPSLNNTPRTSLAFERGSLVNQLGKVETLTINIH